MPENNNNNPKPPSRPYYPRRKRSVPKTQGTDDKIAQTSAQIQEQTILQSHPATIQEQLASIQAQFAPQPSQSQQPQGGVVKPIAPNPNQKRKIPTHNHQKTQPNVAEMSNEVGKPPQPQKSKNRKKSQTEPSVKIISLGGLGEIGKNITLIETAHDIVIIDSGLAFPDDDMPGVDLVIPDFTYVIKNKDKVRGVVLTHGHEDHIGSLSYLLKEVNVPVYSARLTIGLVEGKLREAGILSTAKLNIIKAGDTVKLGSISVEFIAVNHSIPDACALAVHTPVGTLVHTGDFKIDYTPVDGVMINLARFGELGSKGVLALMSDSTNAEHHDITASEKSVGEAFERLFKKAEGKRILVASFSSNIHRIQQVIDIAVRHGRRVVVSGRSMENVSSKAIELGYLKVPPNTMVELDKMRHVPDEQLVIITTGSQGEPMSALTRMARGDHRKISVTANDVIIISATPIPGNEKSVGKVINDLMRIGAEVIYERSAGVHVSGHASRGELKNIIALTRPKFYIPVHGEYKHLVKNKDIGLEMGIPLENIVISDIGRVIELTPSNVKMVNVVPSGAIMVDGIGIGDVGSIVLRDRKLLAEDGLIIAVVTIDSKTGAILSGPDVVSRGFVYVRESEELLLAAKNICRSALITASANNTTRDWTNLKQVVKDQLGSFLYSKTKRRPMVLPIIQEVDMP